MKHRYARTRRPTRVARTATPIAAEDPASRKDALFHSSSCCKLGDERNAPPENRAPQGSPQSPSPTAPAGSAWPGASLRLNHREKRHSRHLVTPSRASIAPDRGRATASLSRVRRGRSRNGRVYFSCRPARKSVLYRSSALPPPAVSPRRPPQFSVKKPRAWKLFGAGLPCSSHTEGVSGLRDPHRPRAAKNPS